MSTSIDRIPLEHPPDSLLEDFVSGSLFVAERALIEAHLACCRACRTKISDLTRAGSLFLTAGGGSASSSDSGHAAPGPLDLWQRIEAALPPSVSDLTAPRDPFGDLPVPRAVRAELELEAPLQWRTVGPVRVAALVDSAPDDHVLYLLDSPAGAVFPHHRHLGREDLVVLQGGLTDDVGHMGLGDFRSYGAGTEHAPVMDADQRCLALAVVRSGLEFS